MQAHLLALMELPLCCHLEGFTTFTLSGHFYCSIKYFTFMSNIVNGETMMENFEANQISKEVNKSI